MAKGVLGTAAFSDDGLYRYALGRVWDDSNPSLAWIMLNPSTASAQQDDATIRRCMGFARDMGLGGVLVVNLFALRATDPVALTKVPLEVAIGPHNDRFIPEALDGADAALTIAAWGAHPVAGHRGLSVAMSLAPRQLVCLGRNKDGSPKHPLYLPAKAATSEWP